MFFIALLGSVLGSFMGCVVDRTLHQESFVSGRSHCEYCHHKLAWYDLLPIVSYVLLGGRCHYCKSRIKKSTLYVEIYGMILGIIFHKSPIYLIQALFLTGISWIDYETMWIPDCLNGGFFLSCLFLPPYDWSCILLPLGLYLFNHWIYEIIGEGDLLLLASMGMVLGLQNQLWILFLSSSFGILYTKLKKISSKSYQPYAPFLSVSYFIVMFM